MKDLKLKYKVKYGNGDCVKYRLYLEENNARKFFYMMSSGRHSPEFIVELYHWEEGFEGKWNWVNIGL